MLSPPVVAWLLILGGCCANVLSLEAITKRDKSAGHLISFAQFAFIAAEGFVQQFDFRTFRVRPRVIPLLVYVRLVFLFFAATVLNNIALDYHISIPVHTVFRSSGLAATLLTGFIFYRKRYSLYQVVSCLLVCAGIVVLTLADAGARALPGCCDTTTSTMQPRTLEAAAAAVAAATAAAASTATEAAAPNSASSILAVLSPAVAASISSVPVLSSLLSVSVFASTDLRWLLGIIMLTLTLFLLAFLGHEQERVYSEYGKVWREVMFYQHAVSLPFCLVMSSDIWSHVREWMQPRSYATVQVPFVAGGPMQLSLFVFLAVNLLTQTICFKGVSMLTAHCGALTIALALTLRKFLSLLLSIVYFHNAFTNGHWIGAALVFGGIATYTNQHSFSTLWTIISGGDGSSSSLSDKTPGADDSKHDPSKPHSNGSSLSSSLLRPPSSEVPSELDLLASPNALAVAQSPSPAGLRSRAAASKRAASPRRKSSSGGTVERSSSVKKSPRTRSSQRS